MRHDEFDDCMEMARALLGGYEGAGDLWEANDYVNRALGVQVVGGEHRERHFGAHRGEAGANEMWLGGDRDIVRSDNERDCQHERVFEKALHLVQ